MIDEPRENSEYSGQLLDIMTSGDMGGGRDAGRHGVEGRRPAQARMLQQEKVALTHIGAHTGPQEGATQTGA